MLTAAGVLGFAALGCDGATAPAPDGAAPATQATPSSAPAAPATIEFVEYAYASTYTTQGVYKLSKAQPGDLMIIYLTDLLDFQMPSGWTQIGDTIVLHEWGQYPVKAFYRVRQAGDPMSYSIAETTGFLNVYRNVDPQNPIATFLHAMSQSQTPPVGALVAPAAGSAAAYFFIGLYHSDILAPAGYTEVYGCRHYEGTSHDTGMGHKLGLSAGQTTGGNIFIAAMDCKSSGEAPYKEGVFHVMLRPAGGTSSGALPSGLRLQRE